MGRKTMNILQLMLAQKNLDRLHTKATMVKEIPSSTWTKAGATAAIVAAVPVKREIVRTKADTTMPTTIVPTACPLPGDKIPPTT